MLRLAGLLMLLSISVAARAEPVEPSEEISESRRLALELQLRKSARFTRTASHAWSLRPYGGYAHGMAVATGPDGSVYVAGIVGEHAVVGGLAVYADGPLETPLLARYGPQGGHLWSRSLYEGQSARIWSIDVAPDRSFYVAMGLTSAEATESDFDFEGTVIDKRDAAGRPRWRRVVSSTWPAQVVAASDGGAFVAMPIEGPLLVDGERVDRDLDRRSTVLRFDADGQLQWARRLGDREAFWILSLAIGPDDRIAAAGMSYPKSGGTRRGSVIVLARDGELRREVRVEGRRPSRLWAVAFCGPDRLAALGDAEGPARIGGTKLIGGSSFVTMLASAQTPRWAHEIHGSSRPAGLSCSSEGQVHAVVDFSEVIELDGAHFESAGDTDVLYMVWDHEGVLRRGRPAGGQGADHAIGIDATVGGATILGSFSGAIDWGGGPLSTEHETMFLFRANDETLLAPSGDPR